MKDLSWFVSVCRINGLELNQSQTELFGEYARLLQTWNGRLNLISRKDESNIFPNHLLHSVSVILGTRIISDANVVDIGTGGGLPGVPLKIALPQLKVTLVDSIKKKTAALEDIVNNLGLTDTEVVTGRAEELSRTREFQGRFDYVVSRAAGKLADVVKWSHGFIKESDAADPDLLPGGNVIILKGGEISEELKHTGRLKFVGHIDVKEINLEGVNDVDFGGKKIVLVKIKKVTLTRGRIS